MGGRVVRREGEMEERLIKGRAARGTGIVLVVNLSEGGAGWLVVRSRSGSKEVVERGRDSVW